MRFSRGKIRVRGSFPIFIWRIEYREILGKKLDVVIDRNFKIRIKTEHCFRFETYGSTLIKTEKEN